MSRCIFLPKPVAEARPTVSPFFRLPPPGKVLLHIHDKHRLAPAALTYGGTKNEQTYIALDRAICSCSATEKKYTVQMEKHIVIGHFTGKREQVLIDRRPRRERPVMVRAQLYSGQARYRLYPPCLRHTRPSS